MKKFFTDYIPQVLLIVFSVVLGLFLSGKISERQDKKMAKQLVGHLKKEISHNREEILEWLPYHLKLRGKLDSARNDKNFLKKFITDQTALYELTDKGLFNGEINTAAWETAILSPAISEVSYEQLRDFSKVYKQIDITYEPILNRAQDLLTSSNFNTEENAKANLFTLRTLVQELAGREISLLTNCNVVFGDTLMLPNEVINKQLKERREKEKLKSKDAKIKDQ